MATQTSAEKALSAVDLFAGLSSKTLSRIAARSRPVDHPAGKEVVVEGDDGAGFHLIVQGSVEVAVAGTVTGTLRQGQWFGDISMIDGGPRSATVRTLEPVTTLSLPSWEFRPLLDEEPGLAKAMLLAMCGRLRAAEARSLS